MAYRILSVDDDILVLTSTKMFLEEHGYQVDTAQSSNEALKLYRAHAQSYAAILIDFQMPGDLRNGADLIKEILAINSEAGVFAYSGSGTLEAVQSTWSAGAVAFIEKGRQEDLLSKLAGQCRRFEETRVLPSDNVETENAKLIRAIGMVGISQSMADVVKRIERYRKFNEAVLLLGETGVGKELIARSFSIGADGSKKKKFFAINCAGFKDSSLLESELFGHEKGAFTGADRQKRGVLEEAMGGVVFFDEIHHLPRSAQSKLLRVFQEKCIRRVGSTVEIPVDFRLVAASKPELAELVRQGEFLPDLFYRIDKLSINIPSLRARKEDIEPLISHFVNVFNEKHGLRKSFRLKTVRMMEKYEWPGNIRELENAVNQLLINSHGKFIEPSQLDAKFFSADLESGSWDEIERRHEEEKKERLATVLRLAESKAHAASMLGIPPQTLHSLTIKYGIYRPTHTTLRSAQ